MFRTFQSVDAADGQNEEIALINMNNVCAIHPFVREWTVAAGVDAVILFFTGNAGGSIGGPLTLVVLGSVKELNYYLNGGDR